MVTNAKYNYAAPLRSSITVTLTPIQYIAAAPFRICAYLGNFFTKQKKLLAENQRLTTEQLLLKAKLQKLAYVEQDNEQLHALVNLKKHIYGKVLAAAILSEEKNTVEKTEILDKGGKEGVYVGQAVIDANGVIGQIIAVTPFTSKILLITDAKSAVPVVDTRNGLRSIITGTKNKEETDLLRLINIPDTVDVKEGDVLVTSGVGFKLPAGYKVAVVKQIAHVAGQRFSQILAEPVATIKSSKYVLLVWPDKSK